VERLTFHSGNAIITNTSLRHDESLNRILQHIVQNPLRWATDQENPQCNDEAGNRMGRDAEGADG